MTSRNQTDIQAQYSFCQTECNRDSSRIRYAYPYSRYEGMADNPPHALQP